MSNYYIELKTTVASLLMYDMLDSIVITYLASNDITHSEVVTTLFHVKIYFDTEEDLVMAKLNGLESLLGQHIDDLENELRV